jgi:peptide/nickel transport system permease protein
MISYWIRKLLQLIPVLIAVNILTFLLFFTVNTPDNMARLHLGSKHVTPQAIQQWKMQHGYDKPLFYNHSKHGTQAVTDTLFFQKNRDLFLFKFGSSDQGRDIGLDIAERMWPSLAVAIPVLFVGLAINITFALLLTLFYNSWFDRLGIVITVVFMSISGLFYIIVGQYIFAKLWKWVPLSGYEGGWHSIRYLLLPIAIGVISSFGAATRWYRTIFLEEINKDYVKTARAKGANDLRILFRHILHNGLIPILTGVVVIIPSLFLGSLIMESFFGIPGLGSYTIDAIQQQDFAIVRTMVFIGTIAYVLGLVLTDASYTWADPRIRLNKEG